MKLIIEGHQEQAICGRDGAVGITYRRRDVPFSDGHGSAKDILVGVCDVCGDVVAIPPQSTPAIRAAREVATEAIEANLPAAYLDALDLACYRLNPAATTELRKRLLMYYAVAGTGKAKRLRMIGSRLDKADLALTGGSKSAKRRLSMKVTPAFSSAFDRLAAETKLNRTQLLKALVVEINDDIVKPAKPAKLVELKALAAVVAA
ncbi:hypothetical protein [Dongia sp. agr-C8]